MILLTTLNAKYIQTALALYSLRAYCKKEFPRIAVAEYNINQELDWIVGEIYKRKPRVLGLSTNIWNILPHLELVDRIKKISPETVTVLGGPEVSAEPAELMKREPGIDYIVRGEGEETLLELLRFILRKEGEPAGIKGLVYRGNGNIYINPPRPPLADLSSIPFPYDDLSLFRRRLVYYESSRGCLFNCAYCLSGWAKEPLRYLPVERVKEDLLTFVRAGIPTVKFVDRTFNLDRRRAMEILEYLAAIGGETEFHLEIVGELLDEEMVKFFATAPPGRFRLEVGVQSTCLPALKAVRRFHHLEKLKKNIERITEAGRVVTHLDLIAGLPMENLESFAASFDWTYRLHPDELQLGFLKLLKGSPLREKAGEYGYRFTRRPPYEILGNNWLSYDEVYHLKIVEDLVEKFFNSHRFRYTLSFLLSGKNSSPWRFYTGLASFWEKNSLNGRPLKLSALFDWFWRYILVTPEFAGVQEKIRDLLTLDFHLTEKGGASPSWLRAELPELRQKAKEFLTDRANRGDLLPKALAGVKESEWKRRLKVLKLGINPETGEEEEVTVVIYSPAQAKPLWFRLPGEL